MTVGLRERKKQATRDTLVLAAVDLFEQQGIEHTTVDDIAAAADVSPRTFHRYFATKEDVLFSDTVERAERFAAALAARPVDEPLLDSLRIVILAAADGFVGNAEFERRRLRLIRGVTSLEMRRLMQSEQWSLVVVRHAASRLGLKTTDALPNLLAACTFATLRSVIDRWIVSPRLNYQAEVERSFDLLADLRSATTPRR